MDGQQQPVALWPDAVCTAAVVLLAAERPLMVSASLRLAQAVGSTAERSIQHSGVTAL